jgi:phosphomannomutase
MGSSSPSESSDTDDRRTGDLDVIVKAYDVRGTVPDQINADVAHALGVAFARFAGASRVLVGRDMRPSGPELVDAFARGAMEMGVDVVDLGLVSTDLMYYAAGTLDAPGAVFTASHNPAQYNGVKLCLSGARPVGQDTGLLQVKATAQEVLDGRAPLPAARAGSMTSRNLLEAFATTSCRSSTRRRCARCASSPTPPMEWAASWCPRCSSGSRSSPSR